MHMASIAHSFPATESYQSRAEKLAPTINKLIEDFEGGGIKGVESFQDEILQRMDSAGLLDKQVWFEFEKVGVHVDSREGAMLVPIDAHDLLRFMVENGWSWTKWDAMASGIPPGELGDSWRQANRALAQGSDGLLPPYAPDRLEIVTGRGSHGTAACRIAKFGARGVHSDLCDAEGQVSMTKIIEMQSTMKEPMTKGAPYDVVRHELTSLCPRLMEVLSRAGNAGHAMYRVQTALQHCSRIHNIVIGIQQKQGELDWAKVIKQACIGMGPDFEKSATQLAEFVKLWSGGSDASILTNLGQYERQLKIKRKLYPADLKEIAGIDFANDSRYVPAMVKTLLNAPVADAAGYGSIFSSNDYLSLGPSGRNRQFAEEASKLMAASDTFLTAYARISPDAKLKLQSEMEVKCVMHVHQKNIQREKHILRWWRSRKRCMGSASFSIIACQNGASSRTLTRRRMNQKVRVSQNEH